MKKSDVTNVRDNAEKAYEVINDLISNYDLELLDLAYPNHDGKQDADVISDMMLLRQSANSLAKACELLVGKLTNAIGD